MKKRISLRIKVLVGLMAILTVFWIAFLAWMYMQDRRLSVEELKHQALGIYHYIVVSRRWIAKQAGIFIKDGEERYSLLTPSAYTLRLSEFAQKVLPYSITIAVKDSDSPRFAPDPFERQAIQLFTSGDAKNVWRIASRQGGGKAFVFIAPLYFANECQTCHVKTKLKRPKEVLGCITITLPAEQVLSGINKRLSTNVWLLATSLILAVVFLWGMLKQLVLTPLDHLRKAANDVADGNLDCQVVLSESPEWWTVSNTFNQMVKSMKEQNERLEMAVEEATKRLREANEELQRSNAYKSAFFSNVTHDLKTPITAIKGASEILEKRLEPSGSPYGIYVDIISRNVKKLSKMVQDLITCAKLESGMSELHFEEHDLCEILEESLLMLMPIAEKKSISIDYEPPYMSVMVNADKSMMDQLFSNLISNAIKFSPKCSTVKIGFESLDTVCKIFIEDAGPGIPEEDWENVFKKFYRSKASEEEGMGLGLAICKYIVDAHGGEIWLSRSSLGGLRVNLELPLLEADGERG